MIFRSKVIVGCTAYILLLNSSSYNTVLAKKKTDSPSSLPSIIPSETPTNEPTIKPTLKPTPSPTISPSTTPTSSPTAPPTVTASNTPTPIPSTSPTDSPTLDPTVTHSEKPSDKEVTRSPSAKPTTKPSKELADTVSQVQQNDAKSTPNSENEEGTKSPLNPEDYDSFILNTERPDDSFLPPDTIQTTSVSGIGKGDIGVLMPYITFDIYASDEDESISTTKENASFVAEFLDDVLNSSSGTYKYDYSHLNCDIMISSFNQRRRLDAGYVIRVDGVAYYYDDAPATESIAQTLYVYFAFWGATGLQEYFKRIGLENAVVTSIYIDDVAVAFVSNDNGKYDGVESTPTTPDDDKNFISKVRDLFYNEKGDLSKPSTVAAYVVLILIIVGIALVVYRIQIGRQRKRYSQTINDTNTRSWNVVDTKSNNETNSSSNCERDEEKGSLSQPKRTSRSTSLRVPNNKRYSKPKPNNTESIPVIPDFNGTRNSKVQRSKDLASLDASSYSQCDSTQARDIDPPSQVEERSEI